MSIGDTEVYKDQITDQPCHERYFYVNIRSSLSSSIVNYLLVTINQCKKSKLRNAFLFKKIFF